MRDSQVNRFAQNLSSVNYSLRKDYLNVHERPTLQKDMIKMQEVEFTKDCFSDSVFLLDAKKSKRRCCLVLTMQRVFIFDLEAAFKLLYRNSVEKLSKLTIASQSCSFIGLQFDKDDIIIESFRRVEVVAYLAEIFKMREIPMFKVTTTKTIQLNLKEAKPENPSDSKAQAGGKDKQASVASKEKEPEVKVTSDTSDIQEVVRNAKKSGFMRKMKKGGMFGKTTFNEYFFLLTDVGIIYFRKYGDLKSTAFLPILGGTVKPLPKNVLGKEHVIWLKTPETEKYLQCYSELEMADWIKHIKSVQDSAIGQKDTLKEMKKVI